MTEDCDVSLVLTPQGFALAGIDDYLNEVGQSPDMGDAASRKKRRLARKKRRYSKAGKAQRKAAIAARVATKMAAAAGKTKKMRAGKAARIARRAARKGASVLSAVISGLKAIGLSQTSASAYAKRSIALLSGQKKKTKGKVGAPAPKTPFEQSLITSAISEENTVETNDEDLDDEDLDEGEEGEEAEFDEEYDSGPGGTEIGSYGAMPAIDQIKPYVPWLVFGLGALAIWKLSTPPQTGTGKQSEDNKPAPKKKR